jgi:hypothetical protein
MQPLKVGVIVFGGKQQINDKNSFAYQINEKT